MIELRYRDARGQVVTRDPAGVAIDGAGNIFAPEPDGSRELLCHLH